MRWIEASMEQRPDEAGKREISPEKTHRPAASSGYDYHTRKSGTYCDQKDSLDSLCSLIAGDATLISMFRSGAGATQCPFKGGPPYTFSYNKGSGECSSPPSIVDSCTDESRLLLRYQACPDVYGTESTMGAAVTRRLDCSPPTKVNQVQSPAASPPGFYKRESGQTMPLVGGFFFLGSPVSHALVFRLCSILTSFHAHRLSRPRCTVRHPLNSPPPYWISRYAIAFMPSLIVANFAPQEPHPVIVFHSTRLPPQRTRSDSRLNHSGSSHLGNVADVGDQRQCKAGGKETGGLVEGVRLFGVSSGSEEFLDEIYPRDARRAGTLQCCQLRLFEESLQKGTRREGVKVVFILPRLRAPVLLVPRRRGRVGEPGNVISLRTDKARNASAGETGVPEKTRRSTAIHWVEISCFKL
ncbi:hypothetical protein PR048_010618 [Dryococelus australis]|uniref:DUF7042 domain-containing protein n=1 Tax=Dryococelus australis TaxID=614101 RepID=A0ABQ9I384_9NEOP|nr:hypothetical protein PR048_010618 [Dryococelus australis]